MSSRVLIVTSQMLGHSSPMRIDCSTLPHTTSTFRDFPPVGADLTTSRAEKTSQSPEVVCRRCDMRQHAAVNYFACCQSRYQRVKALSGTSNLPELATE